MRASKLASYIALSCSVLACASQDPSDLDIADEDESAIESTSQALSTSYSALRSGTWSDATLWNPGGVPGAEDAVSIASGYQVTVNTAASAASVTLVELSAAKLFMNDDLSVSGNVYVGKYCSVDLNDNVLTAGSVTMRQGASFLRDPGARLNVAGMLGTYWSAAMALQPQDTVGSLSIVRGTGSTSATSNISNSVSVTRDGVNSSLQLGAPLVLTGGINASESVILDGGYDITAASAYLYSSGITRQGTGKLNITGNFSLVRTSTLNARAGDVIHGNLASIGVSTFARSQLYVNQLPGDMTGLTVDGNLTLDPYGNKSKLTLNFDSASAAGMDWALAWKGNRVAQLTSWYTTTGQLIVNFPAGITFDPAQHIFFDSVSGYTYVGYTQIPAGCEQVTLSAPGCFWMENTSGNYCWVHPTWLETYTQADCDQAGSTCLQGGACYKWAASAY